MPFLLLLLRCVSEISLKMREFAFKDFALIES